MERVREGGSILGFIVVAVVLAGVLVGGAYFVNRQKDQARPPVVQQPQGEKPAANREGGQQPNENNIPGQPGVPQTTPQAGVAHELPATGPGEVLVSVLMIGSVAGLFAGYLRSRKAYLSL